MFNCGGSTPHTHTLTPHFPPPPPPTPIFILKSHAFLEEFNIHYIGMCMYVRSCCVVCALLQRQHRGTRFRPKPLICASFFAWLGPTMKDAPTSDGFYSPPFFFFFFSSATQDVLCFSTYMMNNICIYTNCFRDCLSTESKEWLEQCQYSSVFFPVLSIQLDSIYIQLQYFIDFHPHPHACYFNDCQNFVGGLILNWVIILFRCRWIQHLCY